MSGTEYLGSLDSAITVNDTYYVAPPPDAIAKEGGSLLVFPFSPFSAEKSCRPLWMTSSIFVSPA